MHPGKKNSLTYTLVNLKSGQFRENDNAGHRRQESYDRLLAEAGKD